MFTRAWHSAKRLYTRAIDRYADLLERRPYTTQCTTSAILWGLGDIGAQAVENTTEELNEPTDWRRVGLITVYGGAFVGPLGHAWYEGLDKLARAVCRVGTMRFVAVKIFGDTVVFGPIHVASFFGIVGLAERESLEEVTERMRTDFVPTLLAESVAWPLVQAFNFWLTPVRHQLLVVNVVSLADCTFLSFVKHQGENGGAWQRFVAESGVLRDLGLDSFVGGVASELDEAAQRERQLAHLGASPSSAAGKSSRGAAAGGAGHDGPTAGGGESSWGRLFGGLGAPVAHLLGGRRDPQREEQGALAGGGSAAVGGNAAAAEEQGGRGGGRRWWGLLQGAAASSAASSTAGGGVPLKQQQQPTPRKTR